MQRLVDWQLRFADCIAERLARPFQWGSHDCVLFAADCVAACTGTDPAALMRGTYSDAMGAARVMREMGGMSAIAAAHLGAEIVPSLAQIGDIGIAVNDGRECLVACTGSMWHGPGAVGLCAIPASEVRSAWRLLKERAE